MDRRALLAFPVAFELIGLFLTHSPQYQLALLIAVAASIGALKLNRYSWVVVVGSIPFGLTDHYVILMGTAAALSSYYMGGRSVEYLSPISLVSALYGQGTPLQLLGFITLVGALLYLKRDLRGVIATGVLLIIASALDYSLGLSGPSNAMSDLAFLSLVFGVVGVALEGKRAGKKMSTVLRLAPFLLFPALVAYLGPSYAYYYWTPRSFYFDSDPLSLWIPAMYHPVINEILGTWLVSRISILMGLEGARVYEFIVTFLAGTSAFWAFKGWKYRTLLSLVYQVATPFWDPSLSWGFAFLPLLIALANSNLRPYLRYPALMLASVSGSSFFLLPATATIASGWIRKERLYVVLAVIGANMFWIVPYAVLGGPSLGQVELTLPLLVALTVAVVASTSGGDTYSTILVVASAVYMAFHLPFYQALYPTLVLGLLWLVESVSRSEIKEVLVGFAVFLVVLSAAQGIYTFTPVSEVKVPSIEGSLGGLTFWNYSYPLASPVPINSTPVPVSAIEYIVRPNGSIRNNSAFLGFPAYASPIFNRTTYPANGSWVEVPRPIAIYSGGNLTPPLRSAGLIVETLNTTVELSSTQGIQVAAWPLLLNQTRVSLSFSASGLYGGYVFIGSNYTVKSGFPSIGLLIGLGKGSVFYENDSLPRYVGTLSYFNTAYPFSVTFFLRDINGSVQIFGEYVNDTFIPTSIETPLTWSSAKFFGVGVERGGPLLLRSVKVGVPFLLEVNQRNVSWTGDNATIIFLLDKPLNGTLYLNSSSPVTAKFLLTNGSEVSPDKAVTGIQGIVLNSEGPVTLTLLKLVDQGIQFYAVGYPGPEKPRLSLNDSLTLGGEILRVQSDAPVLVHLLNYSALTYLMDGHKVIGNVTLPPGTHELSAIYSGQDLANYGAAASITSFILAPILCLSKVRRLLKVVVEAMRHTSASFKSQESELDQG